MDTMSKRIGAQRRRRQLPLHLMLLPGVILVFIFSYIPLGGLIIAFQKVYPAKGLFEAVSYTHLDVYKRQCTSWSAARGDACSA